MCFGRRSTFKRDDENFLAPRPVAMKASTSSDDSHSRSASATNPFEAHLQHQIEITATLDEDSTVLHSKSNYTHSEPLRTPTRGPATVSLALPKPYKHTPPSHHHTASLQPSILLNRDEPSNITHIRSRSAQSDPTTLEKLTAEPAQPTASSPAPKPAKLPQYTISGQRPPRSQPPHLSYERYEIWDPVQKENHYVGGPDLEWKTAVVDLRIESDLLDDYIGWARDRHDELRIEGDLLKSGQLSLSEQGTNGRKELRRLNKGDRKFFAELERDLKREFRSVGRETWENDERWGKEEGDSGVVWEVVERLEREKLERKKAERDKEK